MDGGIHPWIKKIRAEPQFIIVDKKAHGIDNIELNSIAFILSRRLEGEIEFSVFRTRKKRWEEGRYSETSAERLEGGVSEVGRYLPLRHSRLYAQGAGRIHRVWQR